MQLVSVVAVFAVLWVVMVLWRRSGQVTPELAHRLVKEGAALVDVRSAAEFATHHLEGARNVPLPTLSSTLATLGPKERPVVLYCASGARSAMAKALLTQNGFTQVHDLGALARW